MGGASTRLEEREDSAGDSEENVEEESANVWVSDELAQDLREAAAVAGRGPQEVAGSAQGTEELEARRALSAEDDRKLAAVQAAERQESAQVNAWVTKVQSRTKLHHVPRGVESCVEEEAALTVCLKKRGVDCANALAAAEMCARRNLEKCQY